MESICTTAWKCLNASASAAAQSIATGVCADPAAVPATMSESSVSLRMRGMVTRTFRRLWTTAETSKSVSATTDSSADFSPGVAGTHLMPKIEGGGVAARLQTRVCVMPTPPRVGVAFLHVGERAAIADWLRAADIEPVILVEACLVNAGVAGMALECVIADAALLTREYLAELRRVDAMLPVIAVGDADDPRQAELERRSVAFHARPVDERTLLLAVSLAFAEGRPARRSLRRLVPRLPSMIDGAPAVLLDVSGEGLRVEVGRDRGAKLGPMFHLHVPIFKVGVTVRRVWVGSGPDGRGLVQCGATLLDSDERTMRTWRALIDNATGPATERRLRREPAKVQSDRFLGRVGQMLADTPIVGALALPWRHGSRPG